MTLSCNFRKLNGCDKQRKISVVTFLTTCIRNFLSLFAPNQTKKLNASMQTGIFRGGASAYWFGYFTATANKSFTGSLESRVTACRNTLTTFQTSITKTSISGNFWHSNMTSNFMGAWQKTTTALTGMFEFYGRCTAKTEA